MHSYGINLLLYIAVVFTGFLGAYLEIFKKKRNVFHLLLFFILFYFAATSRIDHTYDYSDFEHYIDYFLSDNDAYFEPGYVFITSLIKENLGYIPLYYVSFFFLLIAMGTIIIERLLHVQYCQLYGINSKSFNYLFTFLCIYCVYTGMSACCESPRPGLASTIMIISVTLALGRKWLPSLIILFLSATIHTQTLIILPGFLLLYFIDTISLKILKLWFVILVVLGLLVGGFKIFDFSVLNYLINVLDGYSDASHYEAYLTASEESFLSTQWITKHVIALLLLFGNQTNKLYNRATVLYYLGLTIGAIMSASSIFLRFEGVYRSSYLLAFYLFLRDNSFKKSQRLLFLMIFLPYYGIMLLRWLGTYI